MNTSDLNRYDFNTDDGETYSIRLPQPLNELTDDTALHLMRSTLMLLAPAVAIDADRIIRDNFSDDDTDYFPARAAVLHKLIFTLTNLDDIPHTELFRRLLADPDFVLDVITTDMNLPINIDYKD